MAPIADRPYDVYIAESSEAEAPVEAEPVAKGWIAKPTRAG
jgi:hypothetical protein